ncbi:hypothetical protein [Candidatus Mycoplasma haematohominis]|uniref:hypothetical protein n=1 Tax=Candidatus Mycoplasma haematohominis TaxID=1494318 RepID=UPI001C0A720D|nr:hypothetical protein [Candidatus Mycoplasma haemohominis]
MVSTKVAGGIAVAVVAIGATGYGAWTLTNYRDPVSLSEFSGFPGDNSGYKGKLGEIYGEYFVSPYGYGASTDANKKSEDNKRWWEVVFEIWKRDSEATDNKLGTEFGKNSIKSAYKTSSETEGDNEKSLNKVCDAAYKKTETELASKNDYKENIWKYCSMGGKTLQTVKDQGTSGTTYTDSQIGKKNEETLASISSENNNWFWALKEKEFFYGRYGKQPIGKSLENGSAFKELFDEGGSLSVTGGRLKGVCKTAYLKEGNDATATDAIKFCTFKKSTAAQ